MSCFWFLFVQVIASTSPEETATVPDLVVTHEEYIRENGTDGDTDGAMAMANAGATSTPLFSKSNSKASLTDHGDLEPAQDNTVVTTRAKYVSSCSSWFMLFSL